MVCFDSSTSRIRLKDDPHKTCVSECFFNSNRMFVCGPNNMVFFKNWKNSLFLKFLNGNANFGTEISQPNACKLRQTVPATHVLWLYAMQQCSFESFYSVPRSSLATVQRMHEKYLSYAKIQTIKDGYKSVLAKLFQWSQTVNNAF